MIEEARKYQAFYTKSTPIVDYMVNKLNLKASDRIFEPCGGDGVFVESILANYEYANIDICELNENAYQTLLSKFNKYPTINIRQCDTLLDNELIFNSGFGGIYDKIIANPPYGAWQEPEKRAALKKIYPNLYAKETYALFLFRCIELLKNNGILTFIIPDTYLNLHMHKGIRKHILSKTKIIELALFPSSFFPGVNFGYANLSIITLQKENIESKCLENEFKVINSFKNVDQLSNLDDSNLKVYKYTQSEILSNPDFAFLISSNSCIANIINNSELKIGDIANCVTGFYSGNDKIFLKVNSPDLKNGKNYDLVDENTINRDYYNNPDILNGIEGEKHFLPIVKGGNIKFLKPESWFMDWSKQSVAHYKTDKRARFQNPKFYFKYGIGVPMISSTSITASLIENKLFDQSIVGIFPKDKLLTYYLLAFFNSPTCNKIIRTINPSTNNPANYIKKIPFVMPTKEQILFVDKIVEEILNSIKQANSYNQELEDKLNETIKSIYGF